MTVIGGFCEDPLNEENFGEEEELNFDWEEKTERLGFLDEMFPKDEE